MMFDPLLGERLAPAWRAIIDTLRDGDWHAWNQLMNAGRSVSDIQDKTLEELIRKGIRGGWFRRRGDRLTRTAEIRLTDLGQHFIEHDDRYQR